LERAMSAAGGACSCKGESTPACPPGTAMHKLPAHSTPPTYALTMAANGTPWTSRF
jgi:hypothetical protein